MKEMKTAIVTGANSGLGYETSKVLAKNGFKVIMACRNLDKAKQAQKQLLNDNSNAKLEIRYLDLSKFKTIRLFAKKILKEEKAIHLLINNAGFMASDFTLSEDGFEMQYATNFLGHFLLTGLLINLINQSENARIVSLSSIAHRFGKIDIPKINQSKNYFPFQVYSNTKVACLIFAYTLQKKLSQQNKTTISVAAHPGVSITNFSNKMPSKVLTLQKKVGKLFMSKQEKGAESILYAALENDVNGSDYIGPSGLFEIKGKPKKVSSTRYAKREDIANLLWIFAEKATGISY